MQQQGGTGSIAIIELAGIDDQRRWVLLVDHVDRRAPRGTNRIAIETTLQNDMKALRFRAKFDHKRVGRVSLNDLPSGGAILPLTKDRSSDGCFVARPIPCSRVFHDKTKRCGCVSKLQRFL